MLSVDTIPGSRYAVKTAQGCDVFTPAGQVICRVLPGILGSFSASGYVTCFSDDAAEVRLVSSGVPGGTGGDQLTISQALAAANRAEESARAAEGSVAAAAAGAKTSVEAAAAAEGSRVVAEEAAAAAAAKAAEGDASAKMAADAVSDALAARDEAAAARDEAAGKAGDAEESRVAAEAAAADARVSRAEADAAQEAAEAAQRKAEQEAAKAEQNAALLGDAALKGADNVFAGKQTLNGEVVLNGMLSGAMLAKINYLQHKYDTCKTEADMAAIDPNYNADLNTGYITCLPSYEGGSSLGVIKVNPPYMPALKLLYKICYYQGEELHFCNPMGDINDGWDCSPFLGGNYVTRYLKRMYAVLPNAVSLSTLCNHQTKLEEFYCEELPKCVTASYMWCGMFWRTALREFHTRMPALKFGGGSYYGMFQECKQLRVCSVSFPALVVGLRMFDGTILDAASACTILDGLQVAGEPDWSGWKNGANKTPWVLTIGIHIDHQNDETVLAAIANAEAKGWTLTVQWNGTPTAQASTMAFGQRVYAKVTEAVRPDGTVEKIMDWGHYLTAPEGYESFRSLESAYRYFGIEMLEESATE